MYATGLNSSDDFCLRTAPRLYEDTSTDATASVSGLYRVTIQLVSKSSLRAWNDWVQL